MTKETYVWCVVKRAIIKENPDPDSKTAFTVPFGKAVLIFKKVADNGMIRVCVKFEDKMTNRVNKMVGWCVPSAFTEYEVKDMSRLRYNNDTGKILPTALRFMGKSEGKILPGEQVSVIAKAGPYCLTSKGWTRFEWLSKDRTIYDQDALDTLCYSILIRAVQDYRICVRRLKQRRYKNERKHRELLSELKSISNWFLSDDYKLMFDAIPGDERLKHLNESLGVDEDWLREMFQDRMSMPRIRTKELTERRLSSRTHGIRSDSIRMSKPTASAEESKSSGNA